VLGPAGGAALACQIQFFFSKIFQQIFLNFFDFRMNIFLMMQKKIS